MRTKRSASTVVPSSWPWGHHGSGRLDGSSGQVGAVELRDGSGALPGGVVSFSQAVNHERLLNYVHTLEDLLDDAPLIDSVVDEYRMVAESAGSLCTALLEPRTQVTVSQGTAAAERPSDETEVEPRLSKEEATEAVRGWKSCLERITTRLKTSLIEAYLKDLPEATVFDQQRLFSDLEHRRKVMEEMRGSLEPKFVASVVTQLEDFDLVMADFRDVQERLYLRESGISRSRTIQTIFIASQADTILEFANTSVEDQPVLRFLVSSHFLVETSTYLAESLHPGRRMGNEIDVHFPPPPSRYLCDDGSEVQLYQMPQTELNIEKSLEILLRAAHLQHDRVPREISFELFVAIAEVCRKYDCTSPLELIVEHRWLPQWVHRATDDKPDGLLLISYVFGFRRLFTRISKTAILTVSDQDDLESKPWPRGVKDKVWAVRSAKMDQVYACCASALQEYIRAPVAQSDDAVTAPVDSALTPSTPPRCPKGSHFCDAASLGWLMMMFAELQILPYVIRSPASAVTSHLPPPPQRSLNTVLDSLRFISAPPQAHRGVCDFSLPFRGMINDIYNSISGLTLFDVAGKHGWALSKHKRNLPQSVFRINGPVLDLEIGRRSREAVALRILECLDDVEGLRSVACVDKCFYETFKLHRLRLERGLESSGPDRARSIAEDGMEGDDQTSVWRASGDERAATTPELNPSSSMTRDEAEKILWPSGPSFRLDESSAGTIQGITQSELGPATATEKFLATELALLEEKTLLVVEGKNLRAVRDQKVGLLQSSEGASSPSSVR